MVLHLGNAKAVGFSELSRRINSEDSHIEKRHSYRFWFTGTQSKPDHSRLELTDWDSTQFLRLQKMRHVHPRAQISTSVPLRPFHK